MIWPPIELYNKKNKSWQAVFCKTNGENPSIRHAQRKRLWIFCWRDRVSALGCPRKVFVGALDGGVPVFNNFEYFRKLGFSRPTVYFCKSDLGSLTMIYTFEY